MPRGSEMVFNSETEASYRRGYIHGAEAVIGAVSSSLTKQQIAQLRLWAAGSLLKWQVPNPSSFELPPAPPTL